MPSIEYQFCIYLRFWYRFVEKICNCTLRRRLFYIFQLEDGSNNKRAHQLSRQAVLFLSCTFIAVDPFFTFLRRQRHGGRNTQTKLVARANAASRFLNFGSFLSIFIVNNGENIRLSFVQFKTRYLRQATRKLHDIELNFISQIGFLC